MSNNTIPAAPVAAPMWAEEVPVRERFARSVAQLSFHPDDVPEFTILDACEVVADLLAEYGWTPSGSHTMSWGDTGGVTLEVWVGAQGSIQYTRYEGASRYPSFRVDFTGTDLREVVPAALAFIATRIV